MMIITINENKRTYGIVLGSGNKCKQTSDILPSI